MDADVVWWPLALKLVDGVFAENRPEMVKGYIKTDYKMFPNPRTPPAFPASTPRDCIGPLGWHVASEEAAAAVERMAGHHTLGVDYESIPKRYLLQPLWQRGHVRTSGQRRWHRIQGWQVPLEGSWQSHRRRGHRRLGEVDRQQKHGEILGCHICGEDASELIAEVCVAKRLEATVEDIISTVTPTQPCMKRFTKPLWLRTTA